MDNYLGSQPVDIPQITVTNSNNDYINKPLVINVAGAKPRPAGDLEITRQILKARNRVFCNGGIMYNDIDCDAQDRIRIESRKVSNIPIERQWIFEKAMFEYAILTRGIYKEQDIEKIVASIVEKTKQKGFNPEAFVNKPKTGSFNPYGNGQTTSRERRNEKRTQIPLPPEIMEILNEEMEVADEFKQFSKPEKNKHNDIKNYRSLNYFKRDFGRAVIDEKFHYDMDYTIDRFLDLLKEQHYDVECTVENYHVIIRGLNIWLNSGILLNFHSLKRRIESNAQFVLPTFRKNAFAIRRVVYRYLWLLDLPLAVKEAIKTKAQGDGVFSSLVKMVVDEAVEKVKLDITNMFATTWQTVKEKILSIFRAVYAFWNEHATNIIYGIGITLGIVLLILFSIGWQQWTDEFMSWVTGKEFQNGRLKSQSDEIRSQSGPCFNDFYSALLAGWKGFTDVQKVTQTLSNFVVNLKNLKDFILSVTDLIRQTIDTIAELLWGEPLTEIGKNTKEIKKLHEELVVKVSQMRVTDHSDLTWAEQFKELYTKVSFYHSKMKPNNPASKVFLESIGRQMNNWRSIFNQVQLTILQSQNLKDREEPLGFYLYGPASAGKTFFSQLLSSFLYKRWEDKKLTNLDVYSRTQKDPFWSGHRGNPYVVMVDEFLQSRDPNDQISSALEVICMINSAAYNLVMADLADKGVTFFKAKLVFLTSNADLNPVVPIQEPLALWRRLISIKIVRNKKNLTANNLTEEKLNDCYRFDVRYYQKGDVEKERECDSINFTELLAIIEERRKYNAEQNKIEFVFPQEFVKKELPIPPESKAPIKPIPGKMVYNNKVISFQDKNYEQLFRDMYSRHSEKNENVQTFVDRMLAYAKPEKDDEIEDLNFKKQILINFDMCGIISSDSAKFKILALQTEKEKILAHGFFDGLLPSIPLFNYVGVKSTNCFTYKQSLEAWNLRITAKFQDWIRKNKGFITVKDLKKDSMKILYVLTRCYNHELLYLLDNQSQVLQAFNKNFTFIWEVLEAKYELQSSVNLFEFIGKGVTPPDDWTTTFSCYPDIAQEDRFFVEVYEGEKTLEVCGERIITIKGQRYYDYWSRPRNDESYKSLCQFIEKVAPENYSGYFTNPLMAESWLSLYAPIVISPIVIGLICVGVVSIVGALAVVFNVNISDTIFGNSSNPHIRKWEKLWNRKQGFKGRHVKGLKSQGADKKATSVAHTVANNTKLLKFSYSDGTYSFTPCVFICQTVAVLVNHCLFMDDFKLELYITCNQREEMYKFDSSQLRIDRQYERDLLWIQFPRSLPTFRDLHKHLPDKVKNEYGCLTRISFDDDGETIQLYTSTVSKNITSPIAYELPDGRTEPFDNMIEVKGCTGFAGECSLAYLDFQEIERGCLVALHVAGRRSDSYATPLCKEYFDEFMVVEKKREEEIIDLHPIIGQCLPLIPEQFGFEETCKGNGVALPVIGKINQDLYQPTKTVLERSILSTGYINEEGKKMPGIDYEDTMAPARLKPFFKNEELIDPLVLGMKGVKKHIRHPVPPGFDDPELWLDLFPGPVKILTQKEAINGIPGKIASMDTHTSSGPWFTMQGKPQSQVLRLDTDPKGGFIHPDIIKEIEIFESKMDENRLYSPVSFTYVKDELRTLEKVANGESRDIFACAKWYVIIWREQFAYWMANVNDSLDCPIRVGINPYSSDWWYDAFKLRGMNNGEYIIANDIKKFDQHYVTWFANFFSYFYVKAYPQIYDTERKRKKIFFLVKAHVYSYILVRNIIYFYDGMISGGPATAHLNSCFNVVASRYIIRMECWETLHVRISLNTIMYLITFGDDLILALLSVLLYDGTKLTDHITPERFAQRAFELFDMTHTSCDKKAVGEWRNLTDAEFLKRKYAFTPHGVRCPMKLEDIRSHLLWIDSSSELGWKKQTTINCHAALREFFFHGKEVFEMEKARINPFLKSISAENQFFETYAELAAKYIDGVHDS